jgi:type III secretion system FlhB-like substrate exporter
MGANILPERKRLAAVFASFAILIYGTASLMCDMAINYYTVLDTLEKIIPSTVVIGGLGWVIGMILDKPKRHNRMIYNRPMLSDYLRTSNLGASTESENEDGGND